MALANIFQNDGEYDKAVKYLTDALAEESDQEKQEELYSRIALVEFAAGRMNNAVKAARSALAIEDGTDKDNAVSQFIIAQAYASNTSGCSDFDKQAVFWAAYDMMARAISQLHRGAGELQSPRKVDDGGI